MSWRHCETQLPTMNAAWSFDTLESPNHRKRTCCDGRVALEHHEASRAGVEAEIEADDASRAFEADDRNGA